MPNFPLDHLMIEPRHLELLKTLLQQHLPGGEIWAYGSRVTGLAHEASDLDLVVRHPSRLEEETPHIRALREALTESNLPIRVDVVDWARIPDSFRQEIERTYVVIQSGSV
jgi:DNA polymerase sigma